MDGRTVGHYDLELPPVARTSHSTVYLAKHRELGVYHALKELISDDDESRQRFIDEARIAATLAHPNVVIIHDFFIAAGSAWIAMEYFPRGTLTPYAGALTAAQCVGVATSVLSALVEAERLGIVHRDLKPQNLMITTHGDIKVADFGIARLLDRMSMTADGWFHGTVQYSSPEAITGQEVTPRSDLYSLAALCRELLTGSWPFANASGLVDLTNRKAKEDQPSLRGVGDLPDDAAAVLDRMGRRDPARRPAGAAEAIAALRIAAEAAWGPGWRSEHMILEDPVDPPVPPPPPPPPKDSRFGGFAQVTVLAPASALLRRAATRPLNIGSGLAVAAVGWSRTPVAAALGLIAYAALVAISFFDLGEAARCAEDASEP